MSASIPLRTDFSALDLRVLAGRCADASQARRLLSLAAFMTEWIERKQRGLAVWIAKLCGIGSIGLTTKGRRV